MFEEADGIFVKKQGRYRHKGSNSFKLKIAIAHKGWNKTAPKRFELLNKTVVCDIASGQEFRLLTVRYLTEEKSLSIGLREEITQSHIFEFFAVGVFVIRILSQ